MSVCGLYVPCLIFSVLIHVERESDTERSIVTKGKPKSRRRSVTEIAVPPTWKCVTRGRVPSGTPQAGRG